MPLFLLYLLTGCAAAVQILSLALFIVWGRPVSPLEMVALLGSITLVVLAFYGLFRPQRAARVGMLVSAGMFTYYGPAVYAASRNIILLGSEYPTQLFVPPTLLLLTVAYSLKATMTPKTDEARVGFGKLWTLLLTVTAVVVSAFISVEGPTPDDFFEPRKIITLPMSWTEVPKSVYIANNYIKLETGCFNSVYASCACGMEFRVTTSPEFIDYIRSFDGRRVPVKYEVFYGSNGEAISANLVSVGKWPRKRFNENEYGPSVSTVGPSESRNPQDCFVPLRKQP